ncbi:hypothetical protein U1Q18_008417 [Sarracenia purpurea var. burkii]
MEVPQIGASEEQSVLLQCPVPDQVPPSPESSKEDHPSPVSVLEVHFTEDVSSGSGCFKIVSADLQELRMQLNLLKMESETLADGSLAVSEENAIFEDDNWESSYLVDVLINSGFDDPDPDMIAEKWHSSECPVGPWVFDNLEKYYGETTCLRSERRLLFDSINSGLCEILHQSMNPHPRLKLLTRAGGPEWQEHGVEYELRKLLAADEAITERVLDREMQWLGFEDEVDEIGRELERLLVDDLSAELAYKEILNQNCGFWETAFIWTEESKKELNGDGD